MRKDLAVVALAFFGISTATGAQELTLRAVSALAEKTTYSKPFERFIDRVSEAGTARHIGSPKAMPPFEAGDALKSGVVDITKVTGAFYTNLNDALRSCLAVCERSAATEVSYILTQS